MHRIPPIMTERARQLRRDSTPAERKLWRLLSRYRPPFTRQLVVGHYIVDIACREAKLAIELDGSQHLDQQGYDGARTEYLESVGWRVLRLWNSDVIANPIGAAEFVLDRAAECLGGTHPQPLPGREGRVRQPR
ncbi:MAG: endonuclease domain-containing protein, partial [Sphingopyxis sp.]|nr:endonuclease domain-containing protein [Sphingopyxis sp.]